MTFGFMDPFERLLRLQGALDRPRLAERFGLSTSGAGAFPPVNVFQKGDDFVVMAELPGLDKASLTVEIQKNQVRLAGDRQTASADGKSNRLPVSRATLAARYSSGRKMIVSASIERTTAAAFPEVQQ